MRIMLTRMMFIKHYTPNRCSCIKVSKSIFFFWGGGGGAWGRVGGGEGQGGCELRSEAFMKIQKKMGGGVGSGGGGGVGGGGVQGGCEWRSEAFVKIQKKKKKLGGGVGSGGGGSGWGGGIRVGGVLGWMCMEK